MSVLATLLHFTRAVVRAHNNAKVRNLMDTPRAQAEAGAERPVTDIERRSSRRDRRSK